MNEVPVGWLATLVVVAVVAAAVLRAAETAVRSRVGLRAPSRRIRALVDDPLTTAAAAAVTRVVCELTGAVAATVALSGLGLVWWQVLLAALVVTWLAVVAVRWGPTRVGRKHPEATLAVTARLLAGVRVLTSPVRALLGAQPQPQGGDAEIQRMVDRASESELIEEEDREMFRSVLELGGTITRTVMVPRTEMITLASGTSLGSALSLFLRSGYSRVPVIGESVDDLLGVLYLKDVVRRLHTGGAETEPVDELLRSAVFVPESKPVDDLLREMQGGATHIAIVVDEFGGIAGLVTIEDALEEIVGELTDEHDTTGPEVQDLGDGTFRVPARLPLDELGDLFGAEIDDDDVDTAGGLLAKALGKVPLPGSGADVAGLHLVADRAEGRRRRVSTLLVRRAADGGGPTLSGGGRK